jgi:membrane protein DedA with SNARE-associated domain
VELFEYVIQFLQSDAGPIAIFFIMVSCGLGMPLNGDLIMLFLGTMAGLGKVSFPMLLILCPTGIFIGDALMHLLAKYLGMKVFRLWPFYKIAKPQRIFKALKFSRLYGSKVVFLARFVPGTRCITVIISGVFKVPFPKFLFMNFLGLLIFCPIWISLGYYFISSLSEAKEKALPMLLAFLGVVLIGFGVYQYMKHLQKKRGLNAN